jgi:parallel beta-helix repeat protein
MKIFPFSGPLAGASLLFLLLGHPTCLGQGSLTPPGPPGPTMKTLDQIQPRTPISSLPYAISTSGSYYVTGNLTGVSGQNGITITAGNVNVDLNGFTLTGVAGAKIGIAILGGVSGVSVSNGSVNAWPTGGVTALDPVGPKPATGCRFSALHLTANSSVGLNAAYAALVRECIAEKNDGSGISVGEGSTVSHCNSNGNTGNSGFGFLTYFSQQGGSGVFAPSLFNSCNAAGNSQYGYFVAGSILTDCLANSNLKLGISADDSSLRSCVAESNKASGFSGSGNTIEGCVATGNGNAGSGHGFQAFSGTTLSNCSATTNSADGISATGGSCSVTACTSIANGASGINLGLGASAIGCTSNGNSGDGIKASSSCYVARCNADSNTLAGVHATQGDNRIEGNKVTNNANGIKVDATLNLIYGNTARGNNGTNGNYSIFAGNRVGTIVIPPVSGTITNNGPGAGFGSTDPWANIAY